jgi:hypothetical protein
MKHRLASLVVLALVSTGGTALAVDEPIDGHRLVVSPANTLTFDADGGPYTVPSGGSGADPTLNGASVRFWDIGNPTNEQILALPAVGWQSLGTSGYRYHGAGTPSDPCDVTLRSNSIDIDCDNPAATITVPFTGEGGMILTLGANARRYCAVFGGLLTNNGPTTFKRINAPVPALCEPSPAPFDEELAGRIAVVRPQGVARFVSRPGLTTLPDAAGEAPVVAGATIRVFDTGSTAGDISYPLPSSGWKAAGLGYKYRGPIGDPCPTVLLMPKVMKAVCRRDAVDLTPPFNGDVAFVITAGSSARYCVQFGGDELRNDALLTKRKFADAPASCPSPSGAFLDGGADLWE